jgi:hypothetical protein
LCPNERRIELLKIPTLELLAPLSGSLIDPEREAGVRVPHLFGDVDRIVP